jgi:hypothetical protein
MGHWADRLLVGIMAGILILAGLVLLAFLPDALAAILRELRV